MSGCHTKQKHGIVLEGGRREGGEEERGRERGEEGGERKRERERVRERERASTVNDTSHNSIISTQQDKHREKPPDDYLSKTITNAGVYSTACPQLPLPSTLNDGQFFNLSNICMLFVSTFNHIS